MPKLPLSAVIITLNAARQLAACLDSLGFCDEILVVDSGSSDDTVQIARSHGARIIQTEWRGFGPQKQFAVEQAANDWVLCLDADERVSEHLQKSLMQTFSTTSATSCSAYRFPRCNLFLGAQLRHGEGYPDWSLRLFHRGHARWSSDPVHEKVLTDEAVGTLQGDLLHDSAESLHDYLAKQNRYTTLAAEESIALGKRAHFGHLLLSPLWRFLKFYFLKLGFLDGVPGLVHILIGCTNSFAKYAKMMSLQKAPPDA